MFLSAASCEHSLLKVAARSKSALKLGLAFATTSSWGSTHGAGRDTVVNMREHWALDPDVTFLNHGSFGACPRRVLDAQQALRERMELNPVQFVFRELPGLLNVARERAAEFVGAAPEDVAFLSNATEGVNIVLRALPLQPGDEILLTNHTYGACRNVAQFVAEQRGARLSVANVPFPLRSEQQVLDGVLDAVTERTRIALLDHVTSPTGLVFPIERLVAELRARGIDTLVDGAHGPGMVELNLEQLGAAYYSANFHKWGCAPKGAALLWVRRDLQQQVFPSVISHGFAAALPVRFRAMFDWTGTRDYTPCLCIPAALDHLASLCPGGFDELRQRNHQLALEGRKTLLDTLAIAEPAPASMLGSLAAVPLTRAPRVSERGGFDDLYYQLLDRGFEVSVPFWPDAQHLLLRISAQLYNSAEEYERLAATLAEL
jgi:isopenicillin-N epimerase